MGFLARRSSHDPFLDFKAKNRVDELRDGSILRWFDLHHRILPSDLLSICSRGIAIEERGVYLAEYSPADAGDHAYWQTE